MKRIAIVFLAATCLLAGCSRNQKFTVQGELKHALLPHADAVKLEYGMLEEPLQSSAKDSTFTFHGTVKKPVIAKLTTVGTKSRNTRFLILEKGTITFDRGFATGTPLNDSTVAFTHKISQIAKQYSGKKDVQVKAIEDEFAAFVTRHKNDPCAIFAILFGNHKLRKEVLLDLIKSTSPEIQNDGEIQGLYQQLRLPF
jgi:hypothetical protein